MSNKKVFAVVQGEMYEGYSIVAIFSTQKKAEAAKQTILSVGELCGCDYVAIEEIEVNSFGTNIRNIRRAIKAHFTTSSL